MTEVLGSEMKSVIRPLPKYSPDYKPGIVAPHTEIVLYEDHRKAAENRKLAHAQYVHRCNDPFSLYAYINGHVNTCTHPSTYAPTQCSRGHAQ